ncbi:MAG: polyprenyl synthetase family protein, partial [Tidjanibacter sp.]|nr:polyprenyl synthetase family protein [Tidjanibacter sp.]
HLPAVFGCFNHMALTVCEGQQLDMDFEEREAVSVEEYMTMIDKKTAALLAGATIIGAIQGGADNQNLRRLFLFATELGLAFQLQDDLLDSYGTEAQLGKRIGGDIIEGKKTFLTITAQGRVDEHTRKELIELLHNNTIDPKEKIARVLAIYDSLGVKEKTEEEIDIHFSKAIASLSSLTVAPERIEPMLELARSLMNRNR